MSGACGAIPGLPAYRDSLIMGSADNALTRKAMAKCLPGDPRRWLIDAGNDTNWGQVPVGNVSDRVSWDEPPLTDDTCHLAPAPTVQRPDLLTTVSTRPPGVDCGGGPRPHRPEPHHQPDDGVAGTTGGAPHGGGHLHLHGPLPGHGLGDGHSHLLHP